MKDIADFITDVIWFIVTVGVFIVPLGFIAYFGDKVVCEETAKALGFTPHYTMVTGCVVEKPNGTRVLLDQIRNVGISKEGE